MEITQNPKIVREVAIIIFYNDKILLQDRKGLKKDSADWGFFGGGIEKGETPEEAVIRETEEELEHNLQDHKFYKNFLIETPRGTVKAHVYLSPLKSKINSFVLHEGNGMKLFSCDEALTLDMNEGDYQIIKDLRDNFLKNSQN